MMEDLKNPLQDNTIRLFLFGRFRLLLYYCLFRSYSFTTLLEKMFTICINTYSTCCFQYLSQES
ncbi:hypothetical protein Hanom_Chr16g01499531 [Helianthus anomalus]